MKKIATIVSVAILPVIAFAQGQGVNTSGIESLAQAIGRIVDTLIPVVFGLGLLVFFWGLVTYIFAPADDKEKAKKTMLWGVIAIFVMAAVWGLVSWIGDLFGIDTTSQTVDAPGVNIP